MKRIVPIWLILCIGMISLVVVGGSIIFNQRNDTQFEESTYIGDIKALDGIAIELSNRDQMFKQDTTLEFKDGLKWKSEFEALYYIEETYQLYESITFGTGSLDEIYERERILARQPGVYRYQVRDYYTYFPIYFSLSIGGFMVTKSGESELLQITIPESAEIVVEARYNGGTSHSQNNIPQFSFNLPTVMIEDQYYFTLTNYELEKGWYNNTEFAPLEYRGTSGIMMFDRNQNSTMDIPINKAIKVLFPIEIGSGKQVTVLNLAKVTDKDYLALTVLEESTLYLYLYDVKNDKLISKTNVGEIPQKAIIQSINYVEQGEYLLANYYFMIDTLNEESTYESICAVYNVSKEDVVEVCINLNYARELMKVDRSILLNFVDMCYQNNSLYMLFRNNERFNDIDLIVINKDNIIYAGTIQSSMSEDNSIGSKNYDFRNITDYGDRYMKAEFIR